MATKGKSTSSSRASDAPAEGSDGGRRFVRYCMVLLLIGAAGLCWLSLLTFSPTD